jgi:hypothetical protein
MAFTLFPHDNIARRGNSRWRIVTYTCGREQSKLSSNAESMGGKSWCDIVQGYLITIKQLISLRCSWRPSGHIWENSLLIHHSMSRFASILNLRRCLWICWTSKGRKLFLFISTDSLLQAQWGRHPLWMDVIMLDKTYRACLMICRDHDVISRWNEFNWSWIWSMWSILNAMLELYLELIHFRRWV